VHATEQRAQLGRERGDLPVPLLLSPKSGSVCYNKETFALIPNPPNLQPSMRILHSGNPLCESSTAATLPTNPPASREAGGRNVTSAGVPGGWRIPPRRPGKGEGFGGFSHCTVWKDSGTARVLEDSVRVCEVRRILREFDVREAEPKS
jgi:hypothetical protein